MTVLVVVIVAIRTSIQQTQGQGPSWRMTVRFHSEAYGGETTNKACPALLHRPMCKP